MPYAIYTIESKEPSYLMANPFTMNSEPIVDMRFITMAKDPSGVMADLVKFINTEIDNRLRDGFGDETSKIDSVGELTMVMHDRFMTLTSILAGIKLTPVYVLDDNEAAMVDKAIELLAKHEALSRDPSTIYRRVYGGKIRDLRRAMLVRLSNSSLDPSEHANENLSAAIQQLL